jgi:hypothetical protein
VLKVVVETATYPPCRLCTRVSCRTHLRQRYVLPKCRSSSLIRVFLANFQPRQCTVSYTATVDVETAFNSTVRSDGAYIETHAHINHHRQRHQQIQIKHNVLQIKIMQINLLAVLHMLKMHTDALVFVCRPRNDRGSLSKKIWNASGHRLLPRLRGSVRASVGA